MQRSSDLYAKNFVSREEHEQAQMLVEQRSIAVKQSLQTLQRSALEREKQIAARLEEEETTLAELSIEAGLRVLRAPTDGFVTQLAVKGAHVLVSPSVLLCLIAGSGSEQVEFAVSARDIGFVREGLRVRYCIDALPFQEWGAAEGVVQSVAKDISLQEQSSSSAHTQANAQAAAFKFIGTLPTSYLHSARQKKRAPVSVRMTCRTSIVVAEKRVLNNAVGQDRCVSCAAIKIQKFIICH